MLKSTYKPSGNAPPPLPPGWSEHRAPTGHTYYYNEATKESTYKRPGLPSSVSPSPAPQVSSPGDPHASFNQYSSVPRLSDPATANAFLAQYNPQSQAQQPFGQHGRRGPHGGEGGRDFQRPKPQPVDKPKSKVAIPGCEPWILVYTKYGRRFAYNPVKNASYWRIPEKVMKGILELDIQGIKDRASASEQNGDEALPQDVTEGTNTVVDNEDLEEDQEEEQVELGSDYEEVEVTDDEDEEQDVDVDGEHRNKRQRTEDPDEADDEPVEFNEDDIAAQLRAMGEEYGLDPGEYDDGDPDAWPEGAEGVQLSDEDARELFKDLLNDYGINPFSPFEKLIEEGKIIDDARYTILPNMKSRRDVWEEWSMEGIARVKEQRAKEEKKDARIPYFALLQEKASPKLYWQEFRRKYKKEAAMRDSSLNDRDREKWYRDYISRLKLSQDTQKKDLTALLKSASARDLNNKTMLENLPSSIITDMRYIALDAKVRDPIVQTYITTLPQPPEEEQAEEDEAATKAREDRLKREKALKERERVVAEEKRKQAKQLAYGRAMLREEEREIEQAMKVSKRGLQSQLEAARISDDAAT